MEEGGGAGEAVVQVVAFADGGAGEGEEVDGRVEELGEAGGEDGFAEGEALENRRVAEPALLRAAAGAENA